MNILIVLICILSIPFLCTFYSIPAMLTLPSGIRPGIDDLTIEQAVDMLKTKNISGLELMQEARKMVVTRMHYCRRNSYDTYKTAFHRGYGYCVQQAKTLTNKLFVMNSANEHCYPCNRHKHPRHRNKFQTLLNVLPATHQTLKKYYKQENSTFK